jgi:hypothetical protein
MNAVISIAFSFGRNGFGRFGFLVEMDAIQKSHARKARTSPLCGDATACAMLMKLGMSSDLDDIINFANFCFDQRDCVLREVETWHFLHKIQCCSRKILFGDAPLPYPPIPSLSFPPFPISPSPPSLPCPAF